MTTFPAAITGDTGDHRGPITLDGITTLTGATETYAIVWRQGDDSVRLPVTVLNPTARTVQIELGDAPTDWLPSLHLPAGRTTRYLVSITVTDAAGKVWTWPPDTLPVTGRLDA